MSKNKTNFLKIIALVTMLIDHTGYLFFPEHVVFRLVGRIAFPLFAMLAVIGILHTRSPRAYKLRLLIAGIISQIPYHFFIPGRFNVIVFFLMAVVALEHTTPKNPFPLLLGGVIAEVFEVSYGLYGMVMVWIFYRYLTTMDGGGFILGFLGLNLVFFVVTGNWVQIFSLLSLPFLYIPIKKDIRLPKALAYIFYPVHMTLLLLLDSWL
ncbi:MAG: hypothetical protein AVO33_02000 [delta proteobacterium ML8_F1]|nr:MAG: hypothetical protein AVO33_02000 [delta proteobacterium ML8_F1]